MSEGKYSNDPYYITPEQEKKLALDDECEFCDGSGFFYSDPDFGPCNCVGESEAEAALLVRTPPLDVGTWTLTAPDGRTWQADSPLRVCAIEQRERVPASVAYARIMAELKRTEDADRKAEQAEADLRAKLSLESRDEQERVGANTWQDRDADEYCVNRTGPI